MPNMTAKGRLAMARAQIEQEPSLETTEGTGINITCSHPKIQTFDWIQWYRQLPGQAPKLLALTMKESKELPDDLGQLNMSSIHKNKCQHLAMVQVLEGDT
ncbi:hypothetical protein RLOC_00001572 [Lonchura striata]|uniref:TVA4 protein n=1 Tax=Lonchura striata TaxID=40157 RepID=A0A218U718_9PASE|nr:hypothetical protein RLOC_00001572 [Lonchura striata domestica]